MLFRSLAITATAMLGALPIAFGTGVGSELRRPLGVVIAGGVLVAQLATLYMTPVMYLQLARWRRTHPAPKTSGPLPARHDPASFLTVDGP